MFSVQWIRQQALAVGFDDCGVAIAERLDDDAAFMEQWVAQGLHGNMGQVFGAVLCQRSYYYLLAYI